MRFVPVSIIIYNKGVAAVNTLTLNIVRLSKSSHCQRHKENRQEHGICRSVCFSWLSSPLPASFEFSECFLVFHFKCTNVFLPLFALFYQQWLRGSQ